MVQIGITRAPQKKTNYVGSACSGSDGAVNRTLTHTRFMGNNSLVMVGGRFLQITTEYTVSGAVITFLISIDNTDNIMVFA